MKRIFTTLALFAMVAISATAQTTDKKTTDNKVVIDGKTLVQQSTKKATAEPIATGYTYRDLKGNEYPILMTESTGSCYYLAISAKSGEAYRRYLRQEESAAICAALGREYKPKTTTK